MSDTTDTPTPKTAPIMHAAANESIEAMFRRGCDLERQLTEATHQVAKYAAEARSAIDENERLFSQITEWRTLTSWGGTPEIINDFIKGQQTRIHAAQNAEEQRDRLAEALRMIATHNEGDGQCDNGHAPRWLSLDALATLDRKEDA